MELLSAVPPRVWMLLGLAVLGPVVVALSMLGTPLRRRVGLATRLTAHAVALMGFGFGLLAIVATLAVLRTGLDEIRRRHLPAVVALAGDLSRGHVVEPRSTTFSRSLALFRALEPEVSLVAAWGLQCRAACLSLATDPDLDAEARAWADRATAEPAWAPHRTVTLGGATHLLVSAVLRSPMGAPDGVLTAGVHAEVVAQRALRTAVVLVVVAYALLLVVGLLTRRMLADSVARRVRHIADRIRQPATTPTVRDEPHDELTALDGVVSRHVVESVERLRAADARAIEARELAARMEATTTLAAGVAHDFSNLMAGVMVNCENLRDAVGADPAAANALDTVVDCAARGGRLAHQLVAFARGGKYDPTIIDLNVLVEETVRVEAHQLPPGVTITRSLAPDVLRVEADPVQLTQVISNLVRNAVEAIQSSGRPGTIEVRTSNIAPASGDRVDPTEVCITVRDTGPGMAPEVHDRVFEPFFTTKPQGRGMGLAATYGIVTHHGGRVSVESTVGVGTAFTVCLPGTAAAPAPRRTTPAGGLAPGAGATVLVVDDEPAILSATRRMLERRGYRVVTAENGQEAVDAARAATDPIDVILLDLRMPGMSGGEAFDLLVAARPEARIVICSGYDVDASAQALLDRGAVAFVRKPYSMQEIGSAVATALGRTT